MTWWAIVEARDATLEQRAIREVNAGTYVFDLGGLRRAIGQLHPDNDQGEYYLTDVVGIVAADGLRVAALPLGDPAEMTGVNSRADLAEVHRLLNERVDPAAAGGGRHGAGPGDDMGGCRLHGGSGHRAGGGRAPAARLRHRGTVPHRRPLRFGWRCRSRTERWCLR